MGARRLQGAHPGRPDPEARRLWDPGGRHRRGLRSLGAGLTPVEAIRAATLDPARWLADGAEPDSGVVAVGKRADLLLVEGDPSADVAALENIRQVFLAGVPLERTPVPVP